MTVGVPLDDRATKILNFMLEPRTGCDAWITDETFEIQFGPDDRRHGYAPAIAPAILSWLHANAPAGQLPAGTLPHWGGRPGRWSYGPRCLWICEAPGVPTLMIRDAVGGDGPADAPAPFPAPPRIDTAPQLVAGAHPCPHCCAVPAHYRVLRDGGLICLACGASSPDPAR